MIDPENITQYDLDIPNLEENLIFWVLVAGKTAKTIAKGLDGILHEVKAEKSSPFLALKNYSGNLSNLLKKHGIGCYSQKAKTIKQLIYSNLDLRNCNIEDLEQIWGIGMKTSRCFLMHTRRNAQIAGLDTHILKFLRDQGIDAPFSTPSKKQYLELEQQFLELVPKDRTPAEFDSEIWNKYSEKSNKIK